MWERLSSRDPQSCIAAQSRLESRSHKQFTRSEMNLSEVNNDHNQ
jgi:hypothetical protein